MTRDDIKLMENACDEIRYFHARIFGLSRLFFYEDLIGKQITSAQHIQIQQSLKQTLEVIAGVNMGPRPKLKKVKKPMALNRPMKEATVRLTESDVKLLEETTTTFAAQKRLCTILGRTFPLEWKHCINMNLPPEKYNQLGLDKLKDQASPF
jgi:hypothetical protein